MSYKGLMGILYRIEHTDMELDLYRCGAAVDMEVALSITSFCWLNNMNLDLIAFDTYKDDQF